MKRLVASLPICLAACCFATPVRASEPGGDAAHFPPPSPELVTPRPRPAAPPSLHPEVVLRDRAGQPVSSSGAPASDLQTCGGAGNCHDTAWIVSGATHGPSSHAAALLGGEGGCFACHVRGAAPGTPLIPPAELVIQAPTSETCGACHGLVHRGRDPVSISPDAPAHGLTEMAGAVFSGQRLRDSALDLPGKDGLDRSWDVHAERMLECSSCHGTANHPSIVGRRRTSAVLPHDPRHTGIGEYLRRPDHRLTRGAALPGTSGGCESCHDAAAAHSWLPRRERHMAALACESCHVPQVMAPARQEVDWSMPQAPGAPRVVHRAPGFEPVLQPRRDADGRTRLAPFNVVVTWRWERDENGRAAPVEPAVLARAFFDESGRHRPELVRVLDRNGDGQLQDGELALTDERAVSAAASLLSNAGVARAHIAGQADAVPLHHGVAPARWALRSCDSCHSAESRVAQPFLLSAGVPAGARLETRGWPAGGTLALEGATLSLLPADHMLGAHVLGLSRSALVDGLGKAALFLVLVGTIGHGLLRWRAARRRRTAARPPLAGGGS